MSCPETVRECIAPMAGSCRLAAQLAATGGSPYAEYSQFARVARSAFVAALPTIVDEIMEFRAAMLHEAVLLIRGLPVDGPLPPTPRSVTPQPNDRSTFVAEGSVLGVAAVLGDLFAYSHEYNGVPIRTIAPRPDRTELGDGYFGSHRLRMHTELAWAGVRPDYLLLFCVRPQPDELVPTRVAALSRALTHLTYLEEGRLRSPGFRIGLPEALRVAMPSEHYWTDAVPVITGPPGSPQLRVNFNYVHTNVPACGEALAKLEQALRDVQVPIYARTGDLLVIDNRRVAHGRDEFRPRLDGADRWILQAYVTSQAWGARDTLLSEVPLVLSTPALSPRATRAWDSTGWEAAHGQL